MDRDILVEFAGVGTLVVTGTTALAMRRDGLKAGTTGSFYKLPVSRPLQGHSHVERETGFE